MYSVHRSRCITDNTKLFRFKQCILHDFVRVMTNRSYLDGRFVCCCSSRIKSLVGAYFREPDLTGIRKRNRTLIVVLHRVHLDFVEVA